MRLNTFVLLVFLSFIPLTTVYCQQSDDPCLYFYNQLKEIKHEKFIYRSGVITFSWDKKRYKGCELTFITNDSLLAHSHSLPPFTHGLDPVLKEKGWRINTYYGADGPGTTQYGIEKGDSLCVVYADVEQRGSNRKNYELTIKIQCLEK